jgi:hypothetical protein
MGPLRRRGVLRPVAPDEDPLAAVEDELAAEKAAALGRIGRTLEGLLAELGRLRAAAARATGEERSRLVAAYRAAREKAKLWHFYLVVQREAMGLTNHELVAPAYAIPDDIE